MSRKKESSHSGKRIQNSEEDYLLDGKFLTKSELKDRLNKMDVELEARDFKKQFYQDLYNKSLSQYYLREKIKPILLTDIIDRPEKSLNRKREREENTVTTQFEELEETKVINDDENLKSRTDDETLNKVYEENQEIQAGNDFDYEELKNRNLSLNNLMEKIEKDCNDYKMIYKKIEGGSLIATNGNTLSFSKDYSELTRNFNGNSAVAKTNEDGFNTFTANFPQKKLEYEEGDGVITRSDIKNNFNSIENQAPNEYQNVSEIFDISSSNALNAYKASLNQKSYNINPIINDTIDETEITKTMQTDQKPITSWDYAKVPSPISTKHIGSSSKVTLDNNKITTVKLISPDKQRKRESLPGSRKNIKEIINKIEIHSNYKNYDEINRSVAGSKVKPAVEFSALALGSKKQFNMSGITNGSNRSIVVIVRPSTKNVSDFTSKECIEENNLKSESKIPVVSEIMKAYNYKDYSLFTIYTLIGAGLIVISLHLLHKDNFIKNLPQFFKGLPNEIIALVAMVTILSLSILVWKKVSNSKYFLKIAEQDFIKIKELLYNNHRTEDSPIGIFENNFIKDFAKFHNITESKYRKKILPLLIEIRNENREVEENEVLIQEQSHKVWDFVSQEWH